jgi:hypothetical protein
VGARIYISHKGIGTQRPIFNPPRNDDERRANRRVDFVHTITP